MDSEKFFIGVDIEKIARFENKTLKNDKAFLKLIFTETELKYCFAKAKPGQHLAVRYCAKEAVVKALTGFAIKNVLYNEIEILKDVNEMPYVRLPKYPNLNIKLSLSHANDMAIAYTIVTKL